MVRVDPTARGAANHKKGAKEANEQAKPAASTPPAAESAPKPVAVPLDPAAAPQCSQATTEDGAVRNLSAVFASTPLFPKKRKHPDARDVVRTAIAASRQRGLPIAMVGGGQAATMRTGELSDQETSQVMQVERMQVVLRVRPLQQQAVQECKKRGRSRGSQEAEAVCLHPLSGKSVHIAPPEQSQGFKNGDRPATYSFSRVFGPEATQEYCFRNTARNLVMNMVAGERESSVVMTYGITSSGKTYTMEGTQAQPGLIMRSVECLFEQLERQAEGLSVRVSLYEVYNENIYDLLAMPETMPINKKIPSLRLKEAGDGRVFVAGLSDVSVCGTADALDVYRKGITNRRRAETALNLQSSRSHSIFTVTLCGTEVAAEGEEPTVHRLCSLSFVDLAGSERAARTGNAGARLREMVAINTSLMTLGRCLEALRWNQQHPTLEQRLVPYRESKVTHIFRDVLHGWGRVVLVTNVSPAPGDYDETLNVLKYAALASTISTVARSGPLAAMPSNPHPPKAGDSGGHCSGSFGSGKRRKTVKDATESEDGTDSKAGARTKAVKALGSLQENGWEEDRAQLQAEVDALQQKLRASEAAAAGLETAIREEVAQEMQELVREAEEAFKARLHSEVAACEEKYEKRLQIVTRDNQESRQSKADDLKETEADCEAAREERDAAFIERDNAWLACKQAMESCEAVMAECDAVRAELEASKQHAERQQQASRQEISTLQEQLRALQKDLQEGDQRIKDGDLAVKELQSQLAARVHATLATVPRADTGAEEPEPSTICPAAEAAPSANSRGARKGKDVGKAEKERANSKNGQQAPPVACHAAEPAGPAMCAAASAAALTTHARRIDGGGSDADVKVVSFTPLRADLPNPQAGGAKVRSRYTSDGEEEDTDAGKAQAGEVAEAEEPVAAPTKGVAAPRAARATRATRATAKAATKTTGDDETSPHARPKTRARGTKQCQTSAEKCRLAEEAESPSASSVSTESKVHSSDTLETSNERLAVMVNAAKEEAAGAALIGQTPVKRSRITRAVLGVRNSKQDVRSLPAESKSPGEKHAPTLEAASKKPLAEPLRRSRRKTAAVMPLAAADAGEPTLSCRGIAPRLMQAR